MFKKLLDKLSSLKMTASLLALLTSLFLLGMWIPQKRFFDRVQYEQWLQSYPLLAGWLDRIGFTHIFSAPLTIFVWSFFFLNLALVMWKRLPLLQKKVSVDDALLGPESAFFSARRTISTADTKSAERLMEMLRGSNYLVSGSPFHFKGVKNRLSALANPLFHLSFFLILLGGLLGVFTTFRATIALTEGESFNGDLQRYDKPVKLPQYGEPPELGFTILKIVPEVSGVTPTQLTVDILDTKGKPHKARFNSPYKSGTTSCVIKNLGISPLFLVYDENGTELDGAFVRLNVLKGKEDRFYLGGRNFSVRFFPDYVRADDQDMTKSEEFKNPLLVVSEEKSGSSETHRIRVGESFKSDDRTIKLAEMPFWVSFQVVSEKGVPIVYAGLLLASCALVWRLLFYRRDVVCKIIEVDGVNKIRVALRTEFYRALAEEELDRMLTKWGMEYEKDA